MCQKTRHPKPSVHGEEQYCGLIPGIVVSNTLMSHKHWAWLTRQTEKIKLPYICLVTTVNFSEITIHGSPCDSGKSSLIPNALCNEEYLQHADSVETPAVFNCTALLQTSSEFTARLGPDMLSGLAHRAHC